MAKSKSETRPAGNWRNRITALEQHRPADLLDHPHQWWAHPKAQTDALAGILSEVGIAGALIAYRSERAGGKLVKIDGHARAGLSDTPWPVLVLDVDDREADLLLATYDPLSALAQADKAQLDGLLREVSTSDQAVTQMLADLATQSGLEYGKPVAEAPEPEIDRAEELREKWQTERGQLWTIGRHRLLCGDSTKAEDVARLMGGERATAALTDPPYGQGQKGVTDDSPEMLHGIIWGAVPCLPCDNGVVAAFQSPRTFPEWLDATRHHGYRFERMRWLYKAAQCTFPWRGWILTSESILLSSIGNPNWQDLHPYSHDCYYLPEVSGELKEDMGWHGSVKPLAVVEDILLRICEEGATVFDGFLGTGTTLVACERRGRVGRGMDIDPRNTAIALERLAQMGLTPRLSDR